METESAYCPAVTSQRGNLPFSSGFREERECREVGGREGRGDLYALCPHYEERRATLTLPVLSRIRIYGLNNSEL